MSVHFGPEWSWDQSRPEAIRARVQMAKAHRVLFDHRQSRLASLVLLVIFAHSLAKHFRQAATRIRLSLASHPQIHAKRKSKLTRQRHPSVFALANRLTKFLKKAYRDSFLQSHVRGSVALQIQALRDKLSLTQKGFAKKIGKPQSVVSRLEKTEYGRVTVQTLLDIACACNVALIVKFVSYPEFLAQTENMSFDALTPDTIYESYPLFGGFAQCR